MEALRSCLRHCGHAVELGVPDSMQVTREDAKRFTDCYMSGGSDQLYSAGYGYYVSDQFLAQMPEGSVKQLVLAGSPEFIRLFLRHTGSRDACLQVAQKLIKEAAQVVWMEYTEVYLQGLSGTAIYLLFVKKRRN